MKHKIKLTEGKFYRIVENAVKKILNEISFNCIKNTLENNKDKPMSDAFKRRLKKNPYSKIDREQNFRFGLSNAFNKEYSKNMKNIPTGSSVPYNMDVEDKNKPFFYGETEVTPGGDYNFKLKGGILPDDDSLFYDDETDNFPQYNETLRLNDKNNKPKLPKVPKKIRKYVKKGRKNI